jgi:Homing endonuclease associated repeat
MRRWRAPSGGWGAGLRAAGLQPTRRRWKNGEIVEALRAWTARHGRPPLSSDWRRAATDHPTAALVPGRFGSWRAALDAAGLAPGRVEWTREAVVDAIRAHIDRDGRPPLSSEWRRPEGVDIPATQAVVNRFGSWRAAIAASQSGGGTQ